eukprot:42602_1
MSNKYLLASPWKKKRPTFPINKRIYIRFDRYHISLGVDHTEIDENDKRIRKRKWNMCLSFKWLNEWNFAAKRLFYSTFDETIQYNYFIKYFKHLQDIRNNVSFCLSVQQYLRTLRCNIIQGITSGRLILPLQPKRIDVQQTQRRQTEIIHQQQQMIEDQNRKIIEQNSIIHNRQRMIDSLRRKNKYYRQANTRHHQCSKEWKDRAVLKRMHPNLHAFKHPKKAQKMRLKKLFSKVDEMTLKENRSELCVEHVHNDYPQYVKMKQNRFVLDANQELKAMERQQAKNQHLMNAQTNMTQHQLQQQRTKLHRTGIIRQKTTSGVIASGISSPYSLEKEDAKYIQNKIDDGTAFVPLLLKNDTLIVYERYYHDKKQLYANQKDTNLKQDLRKANKIGMNGSGVAIGAKCDLMKALNKRANQLVTMDKLSNVVHFHESNYIGCQQRVICEQRNWELYFSFDGFGVSRSRSGPNHTQCHIYFGALEAGVSGCVFSLACTVLYDNIL